jgi:hypothetical protein
MLPQKYWTQLDFYYFCSIKLTFKYMENEKITTSITYVTIGFG